MLDWMDAETPCKLRLDLRGAVEDWHALAYFNWEDRDKQVALKAGDFRLPEGDYWVRSFWENTITKVNAGSPLFRGTLPAHASLLLALRRCQPEEARYLGSSIHISQGLEVKRWTEKDGKLVCELAPGRRVRGAIIDFALPKPPKKAALEGRELDWENFSDNVYRFELDLDQKVKIVIQY
jgi:alpha-galactosidase